MPIVMNMRWDGVTREEYEEARDQVGWEQRAPEGGLLHIASFAEDGLRVTDIWESADDFNRFVENRLMPVVQEIGIQTQPDSSSPRCTRSGTPESSGQPRGRVANCPAYRRCR